jgi:hypothetical protein
LGEYQRTDLSCTSLAQCPGGGLQCCAGSQYIVDENNVPACDLGNVSGLEGIFQLAQPLRTPGAYLVRLANPGQ